MLINVNDVPSGKSLTVEDCDTPAGNTRFAPGSCDVADPIHWIGPEVIGTCTAAIRLAVPAECVRNRFASQRHVVPVAADVANLELLTAGHQRRPFGKPEECPVNRIGTAVIDEAKHLTRGRIKSGVNIKPAGIDIPRNNQLVIAGAWRRPVEIDYKCAARVEWSGVPKKSPMTVNFPSGRTVPSKGLP